MIRKTWILLFLGITSCQYFSKTNDTVLATVNDKRLLLSDIQSLLYNFNSKEDSIDFMRNWIEGWIKEQLMVQQAQKNLTTQLESVKKQIESYQNSLLIYHYQQALVSQKMDTNVFDFQIQEYYKDHQKEFELKDHIVQMIYVKVEENAPKISKLKKWYLSDNENDKLMLEEYCYQFAEEFSLDDTTWLYFSDVLSKVPIETKNPEFYLSNNKFDMLTDSTGLYLVRFKKHKIKDSISPLALERTRIRNIILNKRKLAFLKKVETELYQNALAKGQIKYEEN